MRVRGIIAAATTYYPEIRRRTSTASRRGAGLRPCSPDGLPYVGRTARFANLSIATGHAMMGVSLGPVTGKTDGRDPRGRIAAVRPGAAFAGPLRPALTRRRVPVPRLALISARSQDLTGRRPCTRNPDSTSRHIFVAFWVAYLLSYLYRTINAVVSPELTRELSLGPGTLGLLTSAYFVAFAAVQLPAGVLLDRFGPRRVEPRAAGGRRHGRALLCATRKARRVSPSRAR